MNPVRIQRALLAVLIALPATMWAQVEQRPPREFPEFRGTWILDESAGKGHISGLPVVRRLVIATTTTEITVTKDSGAPEVYRVDGGETPRAGGAVNALFSYRLTLVGDALALTTTRARPNAGETLTNVITDAYSVSDDVLTIERSLSVVRTPPGVLVTLSDPRNSRQTLVYRRPPTAR
jgi:hypothetical protein